MVNLMVSRLGPLTECEFSLGERMTVLIGPQASGKDTLARVACFSSGVADAALLAFNAFFIYSDTRDARRVCSVEEYVYALEGELRREFYRLFRFADRGDDFRLAIDYGEGVSVTFKGDGLEVELSEGLMARVREWTKLFNLSEDGGTALELVAESIWGTFGKGDVGLLTGERVWVTGASSLDQADFEFLGLLWGADERSCARKSTGTPRRPVQVIEELTKRAKSLLGDPELVKVVTELGLDHTLRLRASQGQSSLLRLLMVTQCYAASGHQLHLVLEYPEAFLYPDTQRLLTEYLALWCTGGNRCTVVTHSPYVLGSLNNLIEAGQKLVKEDAAKVLEVIRVFAKYGLSEKYCLAEGELTAYFVDGGKPVNAVDAESGLIQNELIDGASDVINGLGDELIYL